jgi:hypothetical protein
MPNYRTSFQEYGKIGKCGEIESHSLSEVYPIALFKGDSRVRTNSVGKRQIRKELFPSKLRIESLSSFSRMGAIEATDEICPGGVEEMAPTLISGVNSAGNRNMEW